MNSKLLFLILSIVLLVGCTTQQAAMPIPPQEAAKINQEATAERTVEPGPANSKVLSLLVNKDIVPNIIYEYSRPPEDPKIYIYSIKDGKARIDLPRLNYIPKGQTRLDVVYLDIAAKKATAYCEEKVVCKDRNMAYDVAFEDYYFKSPYDWLKEVPSDAEVVGTEQINTRDVTHLRYMQSGLTTDIWIDEFYNVPLEVETTSSLGTLRYKYHLISIGNVKDQLLKHEQLENY